MFILKYEPLFPPSFFENMFDNHSTTICYRCTREYFVATTWSRNLNPLAQLAKLLLNYLLLNYLLYPQIFKNYYLSYSFKIFILTRVISSESIGWSVKNNILFFYILNMLNLRLCIKFKIFNIQFSFHISSIQSFTVGQKGLKAS